MIPEVVYPHEVVDEHSHVHRLKDRPLGQGGQGVVFRTLDENTAVKLITDTLGRPRQATEVRTGLQRKLQEVRLLPLPELHLAGPQAVLAEPYVGYVMRLLTGMVPVKVLLAPPGAKLAEFYLQGGGLRRRLRLLASAAEVLARLHAVPVVYGDVSPNNVFISEDNAAAEVWLIDADNLQFASGFGSTVFTPGFGAPELVRGTSGASTLTDIHAFAVLAFLVLSQQHPFIGDLVEASGWDADEDLEEKAFAGELPWIHDATDARNATANGIPRDLLLTRGLWDLFHAAFGPGRTCPADRPGMLRWAEALHQAADLTLVCPSCGSSYYPAGNKDRCPWCDGPRPAFVYVEARCWDPDLDADEFDITTARKILPDPEPAAAGQPAPPRPASKPVWRQALVPGHDDGIRRHVVAPILFRDGDPVALEVEYDERRVTVTPADRGEYHVVVPGKKVCMRLSAPCPIRLEELARGWHLHCGPLDRPHRLVSLRYIPGAHA
jgi:DNA-binding helix-hairpin-helix protein with protein kinase domain